MFEWSAERAKRRKDTQTYRCDYDGSDAICEAGSLLALTAATPSFAQTRTEMDKGYPSHYCLPTTVDSSEEQKVYCEGWRAFRKGW